MKNPEEKSMLIHPNRLLEQEVTMITGITNDMLIGKPHFEEIREKVQDFIGNAIIVGHNVLFDIAMLNSHNIDLSKNIVIDTFELSEIFSQDIESLNLGFLAHQYNLIDPNEVEHRALTDTSISIRLLMKYLGEIRLLSDKKKQIWDILMQHDSTQTLLIISKICHQIPESNSNKDLFNDLLIYPSSITLSNNINTKDLYENTKILYEIDPNPLEEIEIIKNTFKKHSHIQLLCPGYKTSIWMSELLDKNNIENTIAISYEKWCSIAYIKEILA